MAEQTKKSEPYTLPSQKVMKIIDEMHKSGGANPFDVTLLVQLSLLDKLEEVVLLLRNVVITKKPAQQKPVSVKEKA